MINLKDFSDFVFLMVFVFVGFFYDFYQTYFVNHTEANKRFENMESILDHLK